MSNLVVEDEDYLRVCSRSASWVFGAVVRRELLVTSSGIRYRALLLGVPLWTRHVPWSAVESLRCARVEGAADDWGYHTLEVDTDSRTLRMFVLPDDRELKAVVSTLRRWHTRRG